MSSKDSGLTLLLTQRALRDIREIEQYSTERWGEDVAERYLDDIEAALTRCSRHPGLLRPRPEFSPQLCFYVVNQHLLVCDVDENSIVVLTVANARLDLLNRLAELEPTLKDEIDILRESVGRRPG